MRPPAAPRPDDFEEVARAVLTGIAGAITGGIAMLAGAHLPILLFHLQGDEAAGLGMVLAFWGIPAGIIVGAPVAVMARRRLGGPAVGLAMLGTVIVSPMIVAAAEGVAVPERRPSADGCRNLDQQYTIASNGDVTVFRRACPGRASTIEATVEPRGHHLDEGAPGNAVAFAARDGSVDGLTVRVMGSPDSIMAFAYDPRLRVVRLTPRIGDIAIQAVSEDSARARAVAAASLQPPTGSASAEIRQLSASVAAESAGSPPPPCPAESRENDVGVSGAVSIYRLDCPGRQPTIEVTVIARSGLVDIGAPGNALTLDASADSPEQPITVRVVRDGASHIVFHNDHRASVIRLTPRVQAVFIEAVRDDHRAARP